MKNEPTITFSTARTIGVDGFEEVIAVCSIAEIPGAPRFDFHGGDGKTQAEALLNAARHWTGLAALQYGEEPSAEAIEAGAVALCRAVHPARFSGGFDYWNSAHIKEDAKNTWRREARAVLMTVCFPIAPEPAASEILARGGAVRSIDFAAEVARGAPVDLSFQAGVAQWMASCFGREISADKVERNHRFLEEALELVQAIGCSESEALQLVKYVYGRPAGEPRQEVGGALVTLAALCSANGIDMDEAGDVELARVWTKIDKIREKQAGKPKHSPLPEAVEAPSDIGKAWFLNQISQGIADRPLDKEMLFEIGEDTLLLYAANVAEKPDADFYEALGRITDEIREIFEKADIPTPPVAVAVPEGWRELTQQAADALHIFTAHDSLPNLKHRYGERWWGPVNALRDKLIAAITAAATPPAAEAQGQDPGFVEMLAQWLHDEVDYPDPNFPDHYWPEHPEDTGQRDGGFLKILPKDTQEQFRDIARRFATFFPGAAVPAAAEAPEPKPAAALAWLPFNINETVRVKLTDAGAAELRRQSDELREKFPRLSEWTDPRDADGWCKMQLWNVMERLGHMCSLGASPQGMPFAVTIELPIAAEAPGEAVAWRYRVMFGHIPLPWQTTTEQWLADRERERGAEVEALGIITPRQVAAEPKEKS